MSDTLKSAADSLAEQTRKLDIASYYTHGDMEKAKQMVSGAYLDLQVLKIRFSSSSVYGAAIVFFNTVYVKFNHLYIIVTPSFVVEDMKTNISWKEFEKDIEALYSKNEHDTVLCNHAREELIAGATIEFGSDLKRLLEQDDAIGINHKFKKFLGDRVGFQQIKISVDYEPSSSLQMEVHSLSSMKIKADDIQDAADVEKKRNAAIDNIKVDEDDPLAQREVKLILHGSLILSPIKGVDISTLEIGTRIKLKIVEKGPKAVSVAKAFKAYNEETGEIGAIQGRIISIKHTVKDGHRIFAVIAKGIYVKILEEEDNIKVAIAEAPGAAKKDSEDEVKKVSLPLLLGLILAFIGIVATIIALVV